MLIYLGLFLPLVGFLILLFQFNRALTGIIACSTIFLSFFSFLILLSSYTTPQTYTLFTWIPIEKINADFTLYLDPVSLVMTLVITGVGFLIHVYSIGYMEHDQDYARYFACLNFFVFSMLLLVLAGHLLVLFVGWEGVGLASYLLIGFWYHRHAAARAATKAFVINRIGDFGLLLGLLLTFQVFGTGNIQEILSHGKAVPLICLLYFIGATGKSAQLPLHTWLPDAMEGPTPVSALIHAATMVTAGVYLVVRMHPLFVLSPEILHWVGDIGAATALFASLCALAQTDLKRVLAYSTISQLGLMFLACGVGAFYAAMFHLTMHAFVKALLFLAAGNVLHMMHGVTNMDKMGGLSKYFTKTHWFFLIGVLALSGIPPFSAFFSKELILEQEYKEGFIKLFYVGAIASILTAIYMTRAYWLTFKGPPHFEEKPSEAPFVMLTPVTLLAFLSLFGGLLGFAFCRTPVLQAFLAKADVNLAVQEQPCDYLYSPETWLMILSSIAAIIITYFVYNRFTLGKPITILRKSFFIDQIYDKIFVIPLRTFSIWINQKLEPLFFDGTINSLVYTTKYTATQLQMIQSGQIRSYIAWMTIGITFLMIYYFY